ncbi:uncharacterized protein LOC105847657 [Hydra vulgaris]|uniref:uncharacterized protein LOC105847657 n=1 Tax=Hydra vulgaris TaxID=6087 RepID=UPI0006411B25|nr:uncharacterized protein LOC105847657 [Hydra vulgaris]
MDLPVITFYFLIFIGSLQASVVVIKVVANNDERRLNNSITTDQHTLLPYTKTKSPIKQCYNKVHECLQSTPFNKNKCLKKFRKCTSKHCSAQKCFLNARKCTIEVETPQEVLKCIRTLKTCIKKKGC